MAEQTGPDFTFDPDQAATVAGLKPLYAAILGPKRGKPTVALGPDRAKALAWLGAAQQAYAEAVGHRSALVKGMDLASRVELVGPEP